MNDPTDPKVRSARSGGPSPIPGVEALERRFRDLLEAAPDALVLVDSTGGIVLVNSHAERLFAYPHGQLIGRPIESLIPDRLRSVHQGHRVAYAKEPRTRPMGEGLDLAARRKDGTEFAAEISLSPVRTEERSAFAQSCRSRGRTGHDSRIGPRGKLAPTPTAFGLSAGVRLWVSRCAQAEQWPP
jgi:PAS domain S-box-containing protein